MARNKVQRPWLPKPKPFESGRVSARWDGYNTTRWRRFSIWYKTVNPICSIDGCNMESYYTDHKTPVLVLIRQGKDPFDQSECQPLCRMHGDQKTGREGAQKKKEG